LAGKPQRTTTDQKKRKRQRPNVKYGPIRFNNHNQHNNSNLQENPIIDPKYPSIYNIAQVNLTTPEKQLLNKGLKFCTTERVPNTNEYISAIDELHRKLLIKGYFLNQGDNPSRMDATTNPDKIFVKKHTPKSNWRPSNQDLYKIPINVRIFADEVRIKLREMATQTKSFKPNLPKRQRLAIKRLLRRNDQIVIRLADKGSGVAILTRDQYKKEAERQLNNTLHYKKLDTDLTPKIRKDILTTTRKYMHKGLISEKAFNIINTPDTKPARFYTLPKIHKNIEDPPGRPIMSANGHPTEKLSEFIDMHLNPYLKEIKSYVKDTNHFVTICNDIQLAPQDRLITFDISSLYTNIPHQEGVEAIKEFMTPRIGAEKADMLAQLALLVLQGNIFEFNDQLYIQISGSAMGTKFAPSLACIFVHILETKFLKNAPTKPKIWKRYIDDIFCVMKATDPELDNFLEWINSLHPTIKFTMDANNNGIPFLDTFIQNDGTTIKMRPYTKPTDTKQYIHPTSCHPTHVFKALPYSQALRLKKITSDKDTLKKELDNLTGYFTNRGYNPSLVSKGINKALRAPTQKPKDNPITMVITYHPSNPPFAKKLHSIIESHKKNLPGTFTNTLVAYRRTRNLKETLTKARFTEKK
jgi:peptide-methionine (R)-S-oxide reductase